MTIQEAIRSGKPFRRKKWLIEPHFDDMNGVYAYLPFPDDTCAFLEGDENPLPISFWIEDILAEDWEIKEAAGA